MFTLKLDEFKKRFLSYTFECKDSLEYTIPCYHLKDFKDRWGDKQNLVSSLYGYIKIRFISDDEIEVIQLT